MSDARFSGSRKRRPTMEGESAVTRLRGAREALRTGRSQVKGTVDEVRSLRTDLSPNFQGRTRSQYEQDERVDFNRESMRVAREWADLPAKERREEEAILLNAMADPELIHERTRWLLDGTYGQGAYLAARDVAGRPRMNRQAWMMQALSEIEWRVPRDVAVRVWKKLTPAQKTALERAISSAIKDASKNE